MYMKNLKTILWLVFAVAVCPKVYAQTFVQPAIQLQNITTAQSRLAYDANDFDWGDYDGDGDLDLLLTGKLNQFSEPESYGTKVFRNDGSNVFYDTRASIPYVPEGHCRWGDFDNDGDLDVLLA